MTEECDGCFQPIPECHGYGSCVKRLRREIDALTEDVAAKEASIEMQRRMLDVWYPRALRAEQRLEELGHGFAPGEQAAYAFDIKAQADAWQVYAGKLHAALEVSRPGDTWEKVLMRDAALSTNPPGSEDKPAKTPLPQGCVGAEHTSPDSWNPNVNVCEDCAPEGPQPDSGAGTR